MDKVIRDIDNTSISAYYDIIAAVDFGTTFSGYAWAPANKLQGVEDVKMNKEWGTGMGTATHKTPTCVLMDKHGKLAEFGYEAEKIYTQLVENKESEGYELYRRFKMLLYKEKNLNRNTTIESTRGKKHKAIDIFALSLKYMKNHMIDAIRNTDFGSVNESKIYWVVTLPAFWGDAAKQFMREAAMMAGLVTENNPKQLLFALEPEAAALYCQSLEVNQFDAGGGDKQKVKFEKDTRYMIVDAGGGTVDVTAHEIVESGNFKEILPASGGDWGGTKVNEAIENMLGECLGHDFMEHYKKDFPDQWLQHTIHLESKKRSSKPDGKSGFKLSMPLSVYKQFSKFYKGKDIEDHIAEVGPKLGVAFEDYFLLINHEATCKLFRPVVNNIVDHVRKFAPKIQNLQYIVLVGGFGESPFLLEGLQEALTPQYQIIIPMNAEVSILKGAVLFGHNPHKVISRISKYTYGHSWFAKFQSDRHDPKRKIKDERGRELCKNAFRIYIEKGESVDVGEVRTFSSLPWSSKDEATSIVLLASDKKGVLYSDEPDVHEIGQIVIKLPVLKKGMKERKIETSFLFGGTEIEILARETTQGVEAKTKIDFL